MKTGRNWRRASVHVAFERLEHIIRADRKAVADGAWRPRVKGEFYPGRKGRLPFKVKPRWRWEVRR